MTSPFSIVVVLAQVLLIVGFSPQLQAAVATIAPPRAAMPAPITATVNGAWTTYHHDNAHTGYDQTMPALASVNTGWTSPALSASVYTEPLIYNGLVYAGAMDNTVYALRQFDGTIQWSINLGAPQTGGWGCGNINPTGILGTPVIDTSTNRIYVVAFLSGATSYFLFGLDLQTGAVKLRTQIQPSGFDWRIEQQRGALALANGYVYVPMGGRAGDCGNYHGYIIAVPTNGGPVASYYVTPGIGAGFWAPGGVVVDDTTGKVFDTSGNGTGTGCATGGGGAPAYENDAVVRFSATLAHEDSFVPSDWQANWCNNDEDLGSASPVLISPTLAFQSGKWGQGFLVNPQALGGLNGQLYPSPVSYAGVDVCRGDHTAANYSSYAYAAPMVYLSCEGTGIVGLQVDTTAKTFTACGAGAACSSPSFVTVGGTLGPPIVAGGVVWAVSTAGGGLYAFNRTTGVQFFHSATFSAPRFSTPSAAGNQIFVSSGNQIRSFVMVPPVRSTTYLSYAPQPLTTTSSAQTLTLTNGSASSLTVSAVNLSGVNPSEFTKGADTCTAMSVAAAGTCTVQYTLTPTDNGVRNASVTFVNNGPNNPTSVLFGVGGTSQASTFNVFNWYDNASPGVNADTFHITNPTGVTASGTITMGGGPAMNFTVGPGVDSYYAFPPGTLGGPVVIDSTPVPVFASLRAWYYQSFNETPGRNIASAANTLYLPWYDLASPGVRADTIHITNVGAGTATGTIALPGATTLNFTIAAGTNSYFSFPQSTLGGPVTIAANQPMLASLRAWYYQSFNETAARPASAAATTQYFPWYDLSSPGVRADTIHITNVSGSTATGTIGLPGATPLTFSVPTGQDSYFAFPGGSIGGPVTISSSQPVLASLRAWYYQSFNEVPGQPGAPSSSIQYFPWYDHFSPGVNADTIHITNPGVVSVSVQIYKVGDFPITFSVPAGQDVYAAFPPQSIGGPVAIYASGPVIASLRAWYYQTFNEVPGAF